MRSHPTIAPLSDDQYYTVVLAIRCHYASGKLLSALGNEKGLQAMHHASEEAYEIGAMAYLRNAALSDVPALLAGEEGLAMNWIEGWLQASVASQKRR